MEVENHEKKKIPKHRWFNTNFDKSIKIYVSKNEIY